jgi:hypothetical protein
MTCPSGKWDDGIPDQCQTCPWFLDDSCGPEDLQRARTQNLWLRKKLLQILDGPWQVMR